MGISIFGSSLCSHDHTPPPPPNPNPRNFRIKDIGVVNNYVIVKIHYPDCRNFEGEKILVFRDVTPAEVNTWQEIDPHFCDGKHASPIARFVPTPEGMLMAVRFCKAMY